jgi:hypothetical protein
MGNLRTVPRGWPAAVLLLGSLALAHSAPEAHAEPPRHFDIPAEGVGAALNEFAREADVTLLFSSSLVARARTPGVHGDMTVAQALSQLLGGTGLGFRQVSPSAIAIVEASGGTEGPSPSAPAVASSSGAGRANARAEALSPRGGARGVLGRIAGLLSRAGRVLSRRRHGQAAPAERQATPSYNSLQEVVVTGTPEVSGVRLLDASFPVSSANLQQIRLAQPSSAADLLKIVPGIWAESSGGETGANIEVEGFPGGGDSPYVTYQIEGSPVYPAPTLSFMDNSSLLRLDDTIDRIEVVQGGPSVVYSNGQMGATTNIILRHGTGVPHGDVALTLGDEGLYRLDGFYGGPLAAGWLASIGGFYRESNGIRNAQFPADDGGQVTETLFRPLPNGSLLLWARQLHDRNLFITDVPVAVSPDGRTISAFPGFDPLTGTFAGNSTRDITVEEFPCNVPGCTPGTVSADLADGRGSDIQMFGSDLNVKLGPWTVSNRMGYTTGRMPTNALFNNFAPQTLASLIAGVIASANADPAVMAATGGLPFTTANATYVGSGAPAAADTYVASLGFWMVDKKIQAFTDDLRFSRSLFAGNTATLGGYFASYSSDDTWYLGNDELMTATANARLIDVALYTAAGAAGPVGRVTQNGILGGAFLALVDHYDGRNAAIFLSDQWRLGPWLLDAEYRAENEEVNGAVEGDSIVDLDANPLTFYNNGTSVANGVWSPSTYDHTLGAWSAGVNYEINAHMSIYGRINQGVHFPGFDDLRVGYPQSQHIQNYQIGYKTQTDSIYASIDAFRRLFYGVPYPQILGNGTQVLAVSGASSWGVDFQADWFPLDRLSLGLTGDWQHAVYTHFNLFAPGGGAVFDNNGNILQRQPRVQVRFTPEYTIPARWGELKAFATVTHVDLRYSDPENLQVLPAYTTLDAGLICRFGPHLEARVQGTNLTNALGLTEGNSRSITSGIATGFEMARPIFGREVQGQLRYSF